MITDEQLLNWFSHHPPIDDQADKYNAIRSAGYKFAQTIVENTPASADQTFAVRLIREAVMFANASIACGGK